MKIPVFVSCPTDLNPDQEAARTVLIQILDELHLEPRSLGRSDYPAELPLREVLLIARHCSGGLVLGFEQFQANSGTRKRGVGKERGEILLTPDEPPLSFPTPWNNLEAGILFALNLPLLIFREHNISGGVFDTGVTDVFIHKMPSSPISIENRSNVKEVFLKWYAKISLHYYSV